MFSLSYVMEGVSVEQTGITFEINPGDASFVCVRLKDVDDQNYDWHTIDMSIRQNEWTRLALPFELFMPENDLSMLDPSQPFLVQITAPHGENASRRAFSHDQEFSGRTMVDNVGYYRRDTALAENTVATLDGTEVRAAIVADLYESSIYVDYSMTDDGIVVMTPGIEALHIEATRDAEGVVGRGQRFDITLSVGPDFQEYADRDRVLILSGRIQIALPEFGSELVFSVRSDTILNGDLDLYATGWYNAYLDFPVSGFWNDVVIPLDPDRPSPAHAIIDYRFPVPQNLMDGIMDRGELTVDVTFDEFRVR